MENIFSFPLKFFNFVISSSLMAVILIFLILAAKKVFKYKMEAKWHYFIWFVLIFRMILPWAPESSFSIFNIFHFEKQTAIIQTTNPEEHNIQVKIVNQGSKDTTINKSDSKSDAGDIKVSKTQTSQDYVQKFTINLKILYWIWLIVGLMVGLYILLNSIIFEIKIKKHNSIVNREVFNVFLDCKYKLNVCRNIPVFETPYVKSPTLVGFMNPRLLLPVNILDSVPIEQLNYVFIHELVHFKRKDIGVNLLTSIILMLHWFNPFLWYAFYKMREDQEIACDALALSYINQNELKEYALTLIKLLENFSKGSALPSTAGMGGGTKLQIIRRIRMIKSYNRHSLKWSVIGFVLIFILSMTSLTNPKAGIFNTKVLASEPDSSALIKEAASEWLNSYSYHPVNHDEKSIAYTITKYMNDVGNLDYRTMTGREGFEYLIPARQIQENSWVENTLSEFKDGKLIFQVSNVDIDFIFIRSEEATACLTGKISRISESNQLPNVYYKSFKALFNLKKTDGKWMIVTTPNNNSLAQMALLPSFEEEAIKEVVNKYINNNYSNVKNVTVYVPPVSDSWPQITVKSMINISRSKKLDGLNITFSEQEFTLQKIDSNWAIINSEAQNK